MYFVILCKQNNLIMFHLPENIKVTESLFTTIREKKAREIDDNKTTRLIVLKHREPTHRHTHKRIEPIYFSSFTCSNMILQYVTIFMVRDEQYFKLSPLISASHLSHCSLSSEFEWLHESVNDLSVSSTFFLLKYSEKVKNIGHWTLKSKHWPFLIEKKAEMNFDLIKVLNCTCAKSVLQRKRERASMPEMTKSLQKDPEKCPTG